MQHSEGSYPVTETTPTYAPGTPMWVDHTSRDVQASAQFYGQLFGWEISAGNDPSGYIHIKNGEEFIGGIQASANRNPNAPPHWLIYFLVSDCNVAGERATGLGAQFLLQPMEMENVGRMAILKDPQGAVFALFQPASK